MTRLSFIFFLLSFFLNLCFAQLPDIEFKSYTTSDGLSTNWGTLTIAQDKDGYLWINSQEGLNRFDGYEFKIYRHNPNDTTSLWADYVNTILVDSKKRLWVGTNNVSGGCLSLYNPESDNFTHYYLHDSAGTEVPINRLSFLVGLTEDKSGNIWISTEKGPLCFDTGKRIFKDLNRENKFISLLRNKYTGLIFEDSGGNLWAASAMGLIKYNPQQNHIKIYEGVKGNKDYLKNKLPNYMYQDSSGVIFIAAGNSALFRYDPLSDTIIRLPEKSGKYRNLFPPKSSGPLFGADGLVTIVNRTSDGLFWLGTINGGLKIYNKDLTRSILYNQTDLGLLADLFEDNQKNIWFCIGNEGFMKVIPPRSIFTLEGNGLSSLAKLNIRGVRGIYESRDKTLWIGTANGLIIQYDRIKDQTHIFKSTTNYTESDNELSGSDFQSFCEDKDGLLWIATNNGIFKYNPKNSVFSKEQFKSNNTMSNSRLDVESIIPDDDNDYLWIATWGNGLLKHNRKTFQTDYYSHSSDPNSLQSNTIWTMVKTRDGDICAGTDNGLSIFDKQSGLFKNFLTGISVNSIYKAGNGIYWLGSSRGLYKLNTETNTFIHFTTKNGLPSNKIGGILSDDNNFIWMATARGVVRLNPIDESFLAFDEKDGVKLNLFETGGAYCKTSDGLFLFGASQGITAFKSSRIKYNTYPPHILITDLAIYDTENDTLIVKRNWNHDKVNSINLSHSKNDIVFNYVGIHFTRPEKNRYKYMLEPYDQKWKDAGNQRSARYTSLDPGVYTFKVMGANSDGVWNPQPAEIQVIILPPWWATWWAYALYVLFGFGLLYSVRRFELKRRLMQAENKRKTEELEEARQLQLSMLPKELPQLPNLDIAVYMQTATEVGGDYYDFNVSLDGTLTVVIGDATGHGMKAGTMVTTAKSLFRSYSSNHDILFSFQEFSRCIREMNFGRIAMCMTMLKISDHTLQIATAGMPPTYIYRSKSEKVEEYQFEAMPLGAMEKFPYELKETQLNAGDTVFLLSDGLPELENKNSEAYGYEKIHSGFESMAKQSPEEIISYFKNEGAAWVNNQDPDDDVTFVVIKVK